MMTVTWLDEPRESGFQYGAAAQLDLLGFFQHEPHCVVCFAGMHEDVDLLPDASPVGARRGQHSGVQLHDFADHLLQNINFQHLCSWLSGWLAGWLASFDWF